MMPIVGFVAGNFSSRAALPDRHRADDVLPLFGYRWQKRGERRCGFSC